MLNIYWFLKGSKYSKNRVASYVEIKSLLFHLFVRASFQPTQKVFLKGFIDRLHVTFDILVIFISSYFVRFLGGANRFYVWLALLYHEFWQFGSLHMSPGSEPTTATNTDQWAILAPKNIFKNRR